MNLEVIQELLKMKKQKNEEGENNYAALATVIKSSGSAPREDGASMLIKQSGEIVDTIGGGTVEKQVIEKAQSLMGDEEKVLRCEFDLTNQEVAQEGGVCGGEVEVLLEIIKTEERSRKR